MNVGFNLPITFEGLKSEDIFLNTTKSWIKRWKKETLSLFFWRALGHAVVDRTVTDEEILAGINSINGDLQDGE